MDNEGLEYVVGKEFEHLRRNLNLKIFKFVIGRQNHEKILLTLAQLPM
jgi:hypothetical protein